MNILFVLENYLPHIGGVEIVFKNLAETLAKQGHEINLVTHRLKNTPKFEIINGVKINRISCLHSRYLFSFLSIPKILKLSKQADLIHTTTFNGAPPSWFVGKITKKKVILTVHEVWINKWQETTNLSSLSCFIHNLLEKAIYTLNYDYYVCVSNATKSDLLKLNIPPEKVTTIYNGIDYEFWNPAKYKAQSQKLRKNINLENNFIYLFYGRPGTSKGLEYLIKAIPIISPQIPHSKLLAIVSQDPAYKKQYNNIIKLINDYQLKDKIIILPPISYQELPFYINTADCIIIPSITEGFGFNAVEASALGRPIVASNTTSLPEVVSGKYILIPPKSPEEIAKAIKRVYEKKYTKTPLKKFTIEDNVDNYFKVYNLILNGINKT
ncbi:glycosyltransferase family 4 protein [Candidatus Woesearchaeota archaeon]|nr:glycosyltransferase family 4 protein [Candidatus Woesearchaeota archaeon]